MTEQAPPNEAYEREDPEINAISERLGVVIDVLGYEDTPEASEARAALVIEVRTSEGYDTNNPKHRQLFDTYQDRAEQTFPGHHELEYAAGYQVALLRLWLDCDDADMFYKQLDFKGGRGVEEFLRHNRGFDACLTEILAIVDDLEALVDGVPPPREVKSRL